MTADESNPGVDEFWMPPLAVFPLSVLVLIVGGMLGHYRGFYAQTEIALQIQIVMIFAIAIAVVASVMVGGENE